MTSAGTALVSRAMARTAGAADLRVPLHYIDAYARLATAPAFIAFRLTPSPG
jgi:hypothetical protein